MSRSGVCGVETGARMRCLRSRAATESGALRRSDDEYCRRPEMMSSDWERAGSIAVRLGLG